MKLLYRSNSITQHTEYLLRFTGFATQGYHEYIVVADTEAEAKAIWDAFIASGYAEGDLVSSWFLAERYSAHSWGGGYITWKAVKKTDEEKGVYEGKYVQTFGGSDHLWD